MPVSKNRRKNGKKVKRIRGKAARIQARDEDLASMQSGVTLQQLINVVAYQDHVKALKENEDAG